MDLNSGDRDLPQQDLCSILNDMTKSMSFARESVRSLREQYPSTDALSTQDGISLLSIKHHLLLSYLHSLTLLSARRALGHSLALRTPPQAPFSTPARDPRGHDLGDRVDALVEARVVLEKIKALEGRMKYQIEKLVKVAQENKENQKSQSKDVIDDPLAFRPNPQALLNDHSDASDDEDNLSNASDAPHSRSHEGIYRPPKLAPTPYTESANKKHQDKRSHRAPAPAALTALLHDDPSRPHAESTSGLGGGGSGGFTSSRARAIKRMTEFEEDNFTRLVMGKRDARQRRRDEEDVALGGEGGARGARGRRGPGGLEQEFGDVLKAVERKRMSIGSTGDGYEELRAKGRKANVLVRSRSTKEVHEIDGGEGPRESSRKRKRSRFETEVKSVKKKGSLKGSK